jgi:hypothetical protein
MRDQKNKQRLNKEWAIRNKDKVKAINKAYRQAHEEEIKQKRKKWVSINQTTPDYRFLYLKGKCSFYKYDLDLTIDDCISMWAKGCFYCKSDISNVGGVGLDRIDNDKGYIKTNVLPCCGSCNLIRGYNLTVKEMKVAMTAVMELRRVS